MDGGVKPTAEPLCAGGIVRLSHGDIAAIAARVRPDDVAGTLRVPLYLAAGARPLRVYLDGPALAVAGVRKLAGRYPLNRLSRVVASGRVEWAAAALAACMEEGVPVTFLRRTGEPLGSLQPARERTGAVTSAIEEFLRCPDWSEVYGNWLRSARGRVAREWARVSGWDGFNERLRVTVYQAGTVRAKDRGTSEGWLASVVAERLAASGLRPAYWGLGGARLELASALADLLRLELETRLEGDGGSSSDSAPARFERHARWLRERCDAHVRDFLLRMRRFLEDGA